MHSLLSLALTALALITNPALGDEFTVPLYDFLSRPDIQAQRITVSHYNPHGVAPGYIFLTPWAPEVQKGVNYDFAPSIYDNEGELVWTGFNSSDRRAGTQVFFMSQYDGEPALAYYHIRKDQKLGIATILNDRYELVRNVSIVDTQNFVWNEQGEALNGLPGKAMLPIGMDMHDLNIVTGPARTEAWPAPGVDAVDELQYDASGRLTGRRRSAAPPGSRKAKRKIQTTALMTMGRVHGMKQPFQICNMTMSFIHSPGFQEVSLDGSNTVLFQWEPAEHIPITESSVCGGDFDHGDQHAWSIGQYDWHPYDFFHRNSMDKDQNGDYLLSARHMNTIYKLSGENGSILWRLGGPHSDFEHVSNVPGVEFQFAWQHDARFADVPGADPANGIYGITFWDNANNIYDYSRKTANFSSGKTVLVDERNMRATLIEAYTLPGRLLGVNQGSHQLLPNGNHIIGGGNIGMVAEYAPAPPRPQQENATAAVNSTDSPTGELVFAAHYGAGPMNSYRALRYDWHGYPASAPALFGYARGCPGDRNDARAAYYYVSWNGATEVATWAIHGSDSPSGPFAEIAATRRTGFESIAKGAYAGYTYAIAYDAQGHELGGSEVVRTWVPTAEFVDDGVRALGLTGRRRSQQIVLDGGSCSSHRCNRGFMYSWSRAKTCPGLEPPPVELDLITDGWTPGGWHMDGSGTTVSITKTYTKASAPPTGQAAPDAPAEKPSATSTSGEKGAAATSEAAAVIKPAVADAMPTAMADPLDHDAPPPPPQMDDHSSLIGSQPPPPPPPEDEEHPPPPAAQSLDSTTQDEIKAPPRRRDRR